MPKKFIVTLAVLMSLSLGWQSEVLGQRVKAPARATMTTKAARVKAKASARAKPVGQRKATGLLKGAFKGVFGKAKGTSATTNKTKPGAAKPLRAKVDKKATTATAAKKNAKVAAPAGAGKPAPQTKAQKAEAKKQDAEARKATKEVKANDKAANRVLPERKTPIHQELKDPNFFGEKDAINEYLKVELVQGADAALKRLPEASNLFFSGDVGRLMAARLINTGSRNDADFRYSYGRKAFQSFATADAILRRIPKGELASNFDVALLAKVNKTAFADGGDPAVVRMGKGLRKLFFPGSKSKAGQIRNYQNYHLESKGLSAEEAKNITEHGAKYVKFPFTRMGLIIYAKPAKIQKSLDTLVKDTQARLKDPAADPIQTASRFVQKFIALHPFADGNGRTARLMMDRILAEKGMLPPILKNSNNDIGLTEKAFAAEVLQGIGRTGKFLGLSAYHSSSPDIGNRSLHSGANYVERMMTQHGHTISGIASQKLARRDGLSYGLGKDGFVYDLAGRAHMADKNGDLRPLSQMTLYILMRRVSERKNAPDILQQITTPTRLAFDKLLNSRGKGKGPKVLSDLGAIKSDGRLAVNVDGINNQMLISLLNPANIPTKTLFAKSGSGSRLTTIMSHYQQADLELWHVKEAFAGKGDKSAVAKIEKHRDRLFARARTELRSHVKKGKKGKKDADGDDNPLGAKQEYERIQYNYSPLRYAKRKDYVKKHGDTDAYIFRGENFAKWTGVHIDGIPFRPGLKEAAGMRAKQQGSLNLFDALRSVASDSVGTGVQSYTTDLALLARPGGFADKHKSMEVNLAALPKFARVLVDMRIKDGETIEVNGKTSLFSALFSRRSSTRAGHFSVQAMDTKEIAHFVRKNAPSDKVEPLTQRIAEARAKVNAKKGFFAKLTSLGRSPRLKEVKVDDILNSTQLNSFNTALARSRNLITARRDGDSLNVTAHRRANVFRVQKKHLLPGIDSLGGSLVFEQEVHVMAAVLPHRILDTFTQKQLSTELADKAK